MQFFYDGQIRRYITQTIRVLSNFVVKYGDGTLHRIPVMYGDSDRQVGSIINQNSASTVASVPRIAVYVSGLDIDNSRLSDATFVGKMNFRERDIQIDNIQGSPTYGQEIYNQAQGKNYTVERLMPTPFKLTMKVDIWSSSTEQKLQILEQMLVLFNPSLEIQTTDNYIDWTSLSVLNLNTVSWSSRQVPVGTTDPIDIATLTLDCPIWISPPVKVKHLGVITKIITSIYNNAVTEDDSYIQGLGQPLTAGTQNLSTLLSQDVVTVSDYTIQVYNGEAILLTKNEGFSPREVTLDIPVRGGSAAINWNDLFDRYPGKYVAGSSMLFLTQPDGSEVVGTIAVNALDATILSVTYNPDTLVSNTGIDSQGFLDSNPSYNAAGSYRPQSPGTFDAIVNPLSYNPGTPTVGLRLLIIEDIGDNQSVADGHYASAWGQLVAKANDIIEWTGTSWHVVFDYTHFPDAMVWQTNIYTGVQYLWDGVQWKKSFEGEYTSDLWRIVL
jgi:hypothetical protein